jgi:hypothetical protein
MIAHEIPRSGVSFMSEDDDFDPSKIGLYTTEEDAKQLRVTIDTIVVPEIDEQHRRSKIR